MITELIFSAVALVFYFGIEMYYQYKDKVSDEDPITETTYAHGGSCQPLPPKEVINVGDKVLVFRVTTRIKTLWAEGVVTEKASNGAIKVGRSWYDDNLKNHGLTYSFTKVESIKKSGNPELKHNPTLKCTITNKTFGVKDLVVFKYMTALYYDQKGVPFLAPSSDKISGVIVETSDVGPSFRIGDEWFPMDRGKGGIVQIESVKRGPEYLYDDPVLLKMDSGELILLDKDQQLQMKKQWALVGQQGVQGKTKYVKENLEPIRIVKEKYSILTSQGYQGRGSFSS